MAAGTVELKTGSKTISGTGTTFTAELNENDFIVVIVGGVTYTLGVAVVVSDTSLTINVEYDGPAATGLAWTPIPAQTLVGITAQIAADTARAIRALNYDKANWQQIFSSTSNNITVSMPDGSVYNGPSWNNITQLLNKKASAGENSDITELKNLKAPLTLEQGGTGATTPGGARETLELGTGAVRDITTSNDDYTVGRMICVGNYGLGAAGPSISLNDTDMLTWMRTAGSGFYRNNTTTVHNLAYSAGILGRSADTFFFLSASFGGNGIRVATGNGNSNYIYELWTSKNTTVDTNNFLKKASPIVRLTNDARCMQPDFAVEGRHTITGLVSANEEAEGVSAVKVSSGVYRITGAQGLADEGWTVEVPQDMNGNRLCYVELAEAEDGITVSVFKRKFDTRTAAIVAGEPMDIPAGRWIDLRLQMPADSAWNKRALHQESIVATNLTKTEWLR